MKMIQQPHHSVHIVLAHVILVKQQKSVTLVLKAGTYMEILVSKIVMNPLDYGTEMKTILVLLVTNLVKLVMNHTKTPMNVLHVLKMLIVMKELLVKVITKHVSLLIPNVMEQQLKSPE